VRSEGRLELYQDAEPRAGENDDATSAAPLILERKCNEGVSAGLVVDNGGTKAAKGEGN